MNILIVGYGDIAHRLSSDINNDPHFNHARIFAIKRNQIAVPKNVELIRADINNVCKPGRNQLSLLPKNIDVLLYIVSADSFNEESYQKAYIDGFTNIMSELDKQNISVKKTLYISSTSVYHQHNGEEVDEYSETRPIKFNGRIMRKAEENVLSYKNASCIRFSGIYGRNNRNRILSNLIKNKYYSKEPNQFSNRIHIEDCVGVLLFLIRGIESKVLTDLNSIILASDDKPSTYYEIQQWLLNKLHGLNFSEPAEFVNKFHAGSKRCKNDYLKSLGYRFIYPDYKSAMIKDIQSLLEKSECDTI